LRCCNDLLASLPASLNGCHGHLLLVLSLLTIGQPGSEASDDILKSLRACLDDRQFPPLIMTTAMEVIGRCSASAPSATEAVLQLHLPASVGSSSAPGTSLWRRACWDLRDSKSRIDPQESSSSLQRALQPGSSPDERIQALEEYQTYPGACDSNFERGDLFERLAELYQNTAHIPLRESILPALGLALVSSVDLLRSPASELNLSVGTELPAGPYQRRS